MSATPIKMDTKPTDTDDPPIKPVGAVVPSDVGKESSSETKTESMAEPKTKPAKPKVAMVTQNCAICIATLYGQSAIDAHMKSKKHMKKVLAAELLKKAAGAEKAAESPFKVLFRCDVCNVVLNSSQQKELHIAGMKHNYRMKRFAENSGINSITAVNTTSKNASNNAQAAAPASEPTPTKADGETTQADLKCSVCNIVVNSAQQLTQHLDSKKHQSRENGRMRAAPYFRQGQRVRGGPGAGRFNQGRGRGGGGNSSGGRLSARASGAATFNNLNATFTSAGFISGFQPAHGKNIPRNNQQSSGSGNNFSRSPSSLLLNKPAGNMLVSYPSQDSYDLRRRQFSSQGFSDDYGGGFGKASQDYSEPFGGGKGPSQDYSEFGAGYGKGRSQDYSESFGGDGYGKGRSQDYSESFGGGGYGKGRSQDYSESFAGGYGRGGNAEERGMEGFGANPDRGSGAGALLDQPRNSYGRDFGFGNTQSKSNFMY